MTLSWYCATCDQGGELPIDASPQSLTALMDKIGEAHKIPAEVTFVLGRGTIQRKGNLLILETLRNERNGPYPDFRVRHIQ